MPRPRDRRLASRSPRRGSRSHSSERRRSQSEPPPERESEPEVRLSVQSQLFLRIHALEVLSPGKLVHFGEALLHRHRHPRACPVELGGVENGLKWMKYVYEMKLNLDLSEGVSVAPDQEIRPFLMRLFRDLSFEDVLQRARQLVTDTPHYFDKMYHDSLVFLIAFLRDLRGVIRHLGWPGGDI